MKMKPRQPRNFAVRSGATEVGALAYGVEYWIGPNPMYENFKCIAPLLTELRLPAGFSPDGMEGALNGYVAFPKRHAPLRARRVGEGILTYMPVHGGVTYAVKDRLGMVYGFDTGHPSSARKPRSDPAWIREQCRKLYEGLMVAQKIEAAFDLMPRSEARLQILDPLLSLASGVSGIAPTALLHLMLGAV